MRGLQDQSVLILGLGDSGLAMARWCVRCGANVKVIDSREAPPQLAQLREELPQVVFAHGAFDASWLQADDVRAVFKSPGLMPSQVAPLWDAAKDSGLWVGTELTLFAQALKDLQESHLYYPKVLAITGTNGKTTVTSLTSQLLLRAGLRVATAGNIGPTLLDTLSRALDEADQLQAKDLQEEQTKNLQEDQLDTEAIQSEPSALEVQIDLVEPDAQSVEDQVLVEEADQALPVTEHTQDDLAVGIVPEEPPLIVPPPPPPADHPYLPQVWVLELSSFQLEGVDQFEPTASTVLNVTQDHLDWHGCLQDYAQAKARIFGQQGLMVLNREDPLVMGMLPEPIRVKLQKPQYRAYVTFGSDTPKRPGDYGLESVNGMSWLVKAQEADETRKRKRGALEEDEELFIQRLMPADALRIRGQHNAMNALAALALATSTQAQLAPMLYGLREYRGEPHRVEPVRIIDGVEYFDDSKGTNVGATVAALRGLGCDRKLVIILGGDGKGQDFSPLLEPVSLYARAVVLIGQDAQQIRKALSSSHVEIHQAASLQEAVSQCRSLAKEGDAVLLSPACASMDMFKNYAHRAQVFVDAVDELAIAAGEML